MILVGRRRAQIHSLLAVLTFVLIYTEIVI